MIDLKIVVLSILIVTLQAQTVQDAINAAGCSTTIISTLSAQLVAETNKLQPGLFYNMNNLRGVILSDAVKAVPYLQTPAANKLQAAINERGVTMTINSALRTLPQQLMLYKWYLAGRCGILDAAPPGQSNHNGGLAVDINNANDWINPMRNNNWRKLGDFDPPHYDYIGSDGKDIRTLSVRAFQILWNRNNPDRQIAVDGIYGPATEAALLSSPIRGW